MDTDRDLACPEFRSDLFAQPARDDEWQNLLLAAGQPGVVLGQFSQLRSVGLLCGARCLSGVGEACLERAKRLFRSFALFIFPLQFVLSDFVLLAQQLSFPQPDRCLTRSNIEKKPFGPGRETGSIGTRYKYPCVPIRTEGKGRERQFVVSVQATQGGGSGIWIIPQPLPERLTKVIAIHGQIF
jgi:hypothetical protein